MTGKMVPLISHADLNAIEHYLKRVRDGELREQYQYATYSQEEINSTFPAIRKLLIYGAGENQKLAEEDRQPDYGYTYIAQENNPRHTFIIAVMHTAVLDRLLTKYKLAQADYDEFMRPRRIINQLFSMKISDMNPTEYTQFLTLIGA